MSERMSEFAVAFHDELVGFAGNIICIDGKAMRGTVFENGRNPDIVSTYSLGGGITLATDMCREKSNEITAVPRLLDKIDVSGNIVTANPGKWRDFLIELKANQRTLRYGIEDKAGLAEAVDIYSESPIWEHSRIETWVCQGFRGEDLIADREKWNGNLAVIEIRTDTERKSGGQKTSEGPMFQVFTTVQCCWGTIARKHWAVETKQWGLDRNMRQDFIKWKSARAARKP